MIRPFGWRAARFIRRPWHEDARINILEGSVRSSKTWAVNAKLVANLATGFWPGGIGLITGNSKASIKTNLLNDLFEILGPRRYKYNSSSGELKMLNRTFRVMAARDESSFKVIKGATVGIWVADEISLYPQSFFDMAVSRMSLSDSRMWGTTNPATPHHYLKTDWIDNEEKRLHGDVWSDHFTLDDNPNIDEDRKEFLKRSFVGVFYKRNIEGLWVVAEGAIYRDVIGEDVYYDDDSRPIGLTHRSGHVEHWIGVDYGTHNPLVLLDCYDDGTTLWIDREYYWDSVKQMRQKTDAEYGADFLKFAQGGDPLDTYGPVPVADSRDWPGAIVDPSAASFIAELRSRGVFVTSADNEVIEGIRKVSTMLNRKRIRIHRRCVNLRRELETYAWDDKAAERGVEQPIKAYDHGPDDLRYIVQTRISNYRLAA